MLRSVQAIAVACLALVAISSDGIACSCAPPPIGNKSLEEIRAEKRNYFLNEFDGAAFSGKIIKRKRATVNWIAKTMTGEPSVSQEYRYTIRVKEYWLGVNSRTIIVYGEPAEQIWNDGVRSVSSCGFKLSEGQRYFFTPQLYQGNLQIGQCDFAGGGSDPNTNPALEFRKIMGEPKRF